MKKGETETKMLQDISNVNKRKIPFAIKARKK